MLRRRRAPGPVRPREPAPAAAERGAGSSVQQDCSRRGLNHGEKVSSYRFGVVLLVAALVGFGGTLAVAQGAAADESQEVRVPTASVEVDGRVLFRVRGLSSYPADQRAAAIAARIETLAQDPAIDPDSIQVIAADGYSSIMSGRRLVMSIFDADARLEDVERRTLAGANAERVKKAITDYRHDRTTDVLLWHSVGSAGATLGLAAVVVLTIWLTRLLGRLFDQRLRNRIRAVGIQSFEILRAERIRAGVLAAISALRIVVIVIATFIYLDYVLRGFPWTRGIARDLVQFVVHPLQTMGQALLADIPDLIFLIVLTLIVRFLLRLMKLFFHAVERGSVSFVGFEREWAWPTYKIARFVVVMFALVVAYPYIPGSGSDAFKGVSLFVGVVVSLGSSSAISNLIAGLMLTYRRAFRIGDRVKIGDVTGDVTEMRLQVTHLRTLKNEEVTIPNSVILGGQVVNYSALAAKHGLILHTTVGIGYETPWRQVEAMLLMAAERTPGLLREPSPFVLQQALGDFCVTYELNAYCNEAGDMMRLYTELHRNILDLFNEYGVQIMTPAYERDPDQPKLVPKEQWYLAPAAKGADGPV